MRCEDVQAAWLQRRASKTGDEPMDAHLGDCEACSEFVRAQGRLDALLSLDGDQPPGPGFDTRFFARLQDEKRAAESGASGGWVRWLLPVASAAAVIALAVWRPLTPEETAAEQGMRPAGGGAAPAALDPALPPPAQQLVIAGEQTAEDLQLAADMELLQELPVLEKLDELEAYEALAMLDVADLDAVLTEEQAP